MDKHSQEYFKTLLYKKTHRARVLDYVLLRSFLSLIFYGFFAFSVTRGAAIVLAILSICAFSLIMEPIKERRLKKFANKKIAVLKKKALLEHVALLSKEDARLLLSQKCSSDYKSCQEGIIEGDTFLALLDYHPSESVPPSAILSMRHASMNLGCSKMELYSCANFSQSALELCQNIDIKIALHGQREIMALAEKLDLLPGDAAVKSTIEGYIEGLSQKRKNTRLNLLSKHNAPRYFYCSMAISLASVVTGYKIYYPLIAIVCVILAMICYSRGQKDEKAI